MRRATDRPTAIGARGGLRGAGFGTRRSTHARINADGSGRCVADVRDASTLHTTVSSGIS
jgi:hypothetical protein